MRTLIKTIPIIWVSLGFFAIPVFAKPDLPDTSNYGQQMPGPGALNYIEGMAHLDGQLLNNKNVGNLDMEPGEVLTTQTGKAEILLTPGAFLRVAGHSAVKMISPGLTDTEVQIVRGEAAVEVDETHKGNDLGIVDGNISIWLIQKGFYEFTANPARVRVFKGQAAVEVYDGKYKKVNGGHEMYLMPGAMQKTPKFNIQDAQDNLYRWSELRSRYEAEAYHQMEAEYDGWDGAGPGWYWDPYMADYAFGGGPFWSPWGWGPGYWGGWGWGGWGWDGWGPGMGFYGAGFYPGFYGGGFYGGGFGGGGFHGGGFHGGGGFGGGGFHGGGGGGRR